MSIKCLICGKDFQKQITSTHLKHAHGMSCQEYKEKFPNSSMISEDLKIFFKERSKKSNESRKGIPRKKETIEKMREAKKNNEKPVWNKGKTGVYSQETIEKKRIARKRQKNSPENNPEIIKKILLSTEKNRYEKRIRTNLKLKEKFHKLGFEVLNDCNDLDMRKSFIVLKCNTCETKIERNAESIHHDKMCPKCHYDSGKTSQIESRVYDWISSILNKDEIIRNTRSVIPPLELDIWIPNKNIAIEFCGLYWHSEKAGNKRFYHKHKYELCLKNNIHLIQIFEDEWNDKEYIVKSRLKNILGFQQTKVDARKCDIKYIDKTEAKEFLDNNHIQGYFGCTHRIGLFYKNELVSVMTFSKPNISKGKKETKADVWEISRFSSKYNVRGAASKLFNRFVNDYKPVEIFSYADLRWNQGKVYEKLGMIKMSDGFPNYWYVSGNKRIHRFALRKKIYEQPEKSERELREEQGYNRIWDCGSSKWVWSNNSR